MPITYRMVEFFKGDFGVMLILESTINTAFFPNNLRKIQLKQIGYGDLKLSANRTLSPKGFDSCQAGVKCTVFKCL